MRYRIGDTLSVKGDAGKGRWGEVLLIRPYPTPTYFMDLHPGALGGYEYLFLQAGDNAVAGNWISEEDLEPFVKE